MLPQPTSAQSAELFAMCEGLALAEGKRANIHADSNYVYELAHLSAAADIPPTKADGHPQM